MADRRGSRRPETRVQLDRAGVSQPYVIRPSGTKQALFIAPVGHASACIVERFRAAAAEQPDLAGPDAAYDELLADREMITVLLHGFAAGSDEAIGPGAVPAGSWMTDLVGSIGLETAGPGPVARQSSPR